MSILDSACWSQNDEASISGSSPRALRTPDPHKRSAFARGSFAAFSDYDFGTLDDKEFEILCAHVLGGAMSVRLERFKRGKDKGVDARYLTSSGEVELRDMVEEWLDDIGAEYTWSDVREVIETFDIESRMDDWFKSNYGGFAPDLGKRAANIASESEAMRRYAALFRVIRRLARPRASSGGSRVSASARPMNPHAT